MLAKLLTILVKKILSENKGAKEENVLASPPPTKHLVSPGLDLTMTPNSLIISHLPPQASPDDWQACLKEGHRAEGGQFRVSLTSLTLQFWEKEPTLPSDWEAVVGHPHSSCSQASLIPALGPRLPGRKPWACTQKGLSVAIRGLGPTTGATLSVARPFLCESFLVENLFSLF